MPKSWISGNEGKNLKFYREALLNYGMNRWGLNKASSVGPVSELIRKCAPAKNKFEEWEKFYFSNAMQKKNNGIKVTREFIIDLGRKLYIKLSEVVRNELDSIREDECIDYVFNLVLNRTFEGYISEIDTVYGELAKALNIEIIPAPDKWDRTYNVDFYIQVKNYYIGIQIKPISSGRALDYYQWEAMHKKNHERFKHDFGGEVFFVYSIKAVGNKKVIHNKEVVVKILQEIERLEVI